MFMFVFFAMLSQVFSTSKYQSTKALASDQNVEKTKSIHALATTSCTPTIFVPSVTPSFSKVSLEMSKKSELSSHQFPNVKSHKYLNKFLEQSSSVDPSVKPSHSPVFKPTFKPTFTPSHLSTATPTYLPSHVPTCDPTASIPSNQPFSSTYQPATEIPSNEPIHYSVCS